jgi:hypothetical protein
LLQTGLKLSSKLSSPLKTPILVSMEWEKLICSYGLQRYGCNHLRNWDSIWNLLGREVVFSKLRLSTSRKVHWGENYEAKFSISSMKFHL